MIIHHTNKYFYLKNKGIINYDEDYISYRGYFSPPIIPDIDKFINYVKKSKGFNAEFQSKYIKNKNLIWANKKDKELKELTYVKDKLKEKKKELKEYNRQFKVTTNGNLNDFMMVLEAKNELAKKDLV